MKKKEYYKETYMGYEINCSRTRPCYLGILDAIFERIQVAQKIYSKPAGFHVRLRLKAGVSPRDITDRLNKLYSIPSKHRQLSNTFKPIWVRVSEHDPDDDGYHHHLAIILDYRKATKASLPCFFAKLKRNEFIEDYKIIEPKKPKYKIEVSLEDEDGVANYFYWLSYIAKSRTKEFIYQTFKGSRINQAS